MKKLPCQTYFDEDVAKRLDDIAAFTGYPTKNAMLGALGVIVSRIPKEEFLARMAVLNSPNRAAKPIAIEVV